MAENEENITNAAKAANAGSCNQARASFAESRNGVV